MLSSKFDWSYHLNFYDFSKLFKKLNLKKALLYGGILSRYSRELYVWTSNMNAQGISS